MFQFSSIPTQYEHGPDGGCAVSKLLKNTVLFGFANLIAVLTNVFQYSLCEVLQDKSLTGIPEVSSLRACLNACQGARACALPKKNASGVLSVCFPILFKIQHAPCW